MIVVHTSALMAIVPNEAGAQACSAAIEAEDELLISAATVAEALVVAERRNVGLEMASLIDGLGFEIAPVTLQATRRVAHAYGQWGKGVYPASLNFGDCFAYALAKERICPLLYVGEDFAKTDIKAAL